MRARWLQLEPVPGQPDQQQYGYADRRRDDKEIYKAIPIMKDGADLGEEYAIFGSSAIQVFEALNFMMQIWLSEL